jgi:hypothetical protein
MNPYHHGLQLKSHSIAFATVRTKSLSEGSPEASGSSLNYGGVAPRLGHGARNDLVRTVAKAMCT